MQADVQWNQREFVDRNRKKHRSKLMDNFIAAYGVWFFSWGWIVVCALGASITAAFDIWRAYLVILPMIALALASKVDM